MGKEKKKEEKKDSTERLIEKDGLRDEQIRENGSTLLGDNSQKHRIQLVTII